MVTSIVINGARTLAESGVHLSWITRSVTVIIAASAPACTGFTTTMDSGLNDLARMKIAGGELPSSRTVTCWAGPGGGESCGLCGGEVPTTEIAFELQMADRTAVLHGACHTAWLDATSNR